MKRKSAPTLVFAAAALQTFAFVWWAATLFSWWVMPLWIVAFLMQARMILRVRRSKRG